MKNIQTFRFIPRAAIIVSAVALLTLHASAAQDVTLTDSTDLTLTTDATPTGDFTDVTPVTGTAQAYVAVASNLAYPPNYTTLQLNEGINGPAANDTATGGIYNIDNAGTLTLTFALPTTVSSVALYFGYGGRENGTYALTTASSADLGAFTLTQGASGSAGIDDLLLTLPTPVTTTGLTLTMSNLPNTASFEDIQVFGSAAVPEPTTFALTLAGVGLLMVFQFRRARQSLSPKCP